MKKFHHITLLIYIFHFPDSWTKIDFKSCDYQRFQMDLIERIENDTKKIKKYYDDAYSNFQLIKEDIVFAKSIKEGCPCTLRSLRNLIANLESTFAELLKTLSKMENNTKLAVKLIIEMNELDLNLRNLSAMDTEKFYKIKELSGEYKSLDAIYNQALTDIKQEIQRDADMRKKRIKELHNKRNLMRKKLMNFRPKHEHESLNKFKNMLNQNTVPGYDLRVIKKYLSDTEQNQFDAILNELLPLMIELNNLESDDKISMEELLNIKIDASTDDKLKTLKVLLLEKKAEYERCGNERLRVRHEASTKQARLYKISNQYDRLMDSEEKLDKKRYDLEVLRNKYTAEFYDFRKYVVCLDD